MSDNPTDGKTLRSGFKAIVKNLPKRATLSNLRNSSSTSLSAIKKSKLNKSNDSILSFAGSDGSDDRKRKVPATENTNIISNVSLAGPKKP
ncbi:hypothetical protein OPQ81_008429 [Rhizoctonia solani]|nr:hypothetical protein OPQ81_008429 [Rhizoctonia solani]